MANIFPHSQSSQILAAKPIRGRPLADPVWRYNGVPTDTYDMTGRRVLNRGFREKFYQDHAEVTMPYHPAETDIYAKRELMDTNFHEAGTTWRDYDQSVMVMKRVGSDADGQTIMQVGQSPGTIAARQRLVNLFRYGGFNNNYRKDHTMAAPYSPEETGLSKSVDIDHTRSDSMKKYQYQRASDAQRVKYQLAMQKPDNGVVVSDHDGSTLMSRSLFNKEDLAAARANQASIKGYKYKQYLQRLDNALKSIRIGADGQIQDAHIVSQWSQGPYTPFQAALPNYVTTESYMDNEISRGSAAIDVTNKLKSMQEFDQRYDGQKVADVRSTMNGVQSGPKQFEVSQFKNDETKFVEKLATDKTIASLAKKFNRLEGDNDTEKTDMLKTKAIARMEYQTAEMILAAHAVGTNDHFKDESRLNTSIMYAMSKELPDMRSTQSDAHNLIEKVITGITGKTKPNTYESMSKKLEQSIEQQEVLKANYHKDMSTASPDEAVTWQRMRDMDTELYDVSKHAVATIVLNPIKDMSQSSYSRENWEISPIDSRTTMTRTNITDRPGTSSLKNTHMEQDKVRATEKAFRAIQFSGRPSLRTSQEKSVDIQ